jgi:hypothetical protein
VNGVLHNIGWSNEVAGGAGTATAGCVFQAGAGALPAGACEQAG